MQLFYVVSLTELLFSIAIFGVQARALSYEKPAYYYGTLIGKPIAYMQYVLYVYEYGLPTNPQHAHKLFMLQYRRSDENVWIPHKFSQL